MFNSLTRFLYKVSKRYASNKAGKSTISKDIKEPLSSIDYGSDAPGKLEPIITENLDKAYEIRQIKKEQKLTFKSLNQSDWKLLDQLMSTLIITSMFIVGISSCVVYYTVKTTLRIKNISSQLILILIEKLKNHNNANGKPPKALNIKPDFISNATITNKNGSSPNVRLIGEYNTKFTPLITAKMHDNSKAFKLEDLGKIESLSESMKYFPFIKPFFPKHR